jgi:peroxiredoxin
VQKLAKRPFAIIGVNLLGHQPKALKEVMEKEKLGWRSFADRAIAGKWHVSATPTLYLIDHRGVIRRKWVGNPGEKALEAAIESLLQEAEGSAPKATPGKGG